MKKLILITLGALPLFAAAQVPSYVPTNGLVGWWPFNGNANDESGNGNNGTVNGATLTTDRNGNSNAAYSFDGSDWIDVASSNSIDTIEAIDQFSFSIWFNNQNSDPNSVFSLFDKHNVTTDQGWEIFVALNFIEFILDGTATICYLPQNTCFPNIPVQTWQHLVFTYNRQQQQGELFLNGTSVCVRTINEDIPNSNSGPLVFGYSPGGPDEFSMGPLDDIGMWNRALTPQEVSALYNGCSNSITAQPANQSLATGNNAVFTTNSSDPNATYQWQTDLGLGFQNLSNAGQYSGVTTNTLNVNSVNAGNNNQAFRCIVSSGSCTDTTSTAYISITTGITENTSSSFTVYPNPANNNITVSWSAADIKTLTLRDAAGRAVRTYNVSGTQAQLSLEGLASGVYFLSVGEDTKAVQRIVKQ